MKILNSTGKLNGSTTYMGYSNFYCLAAEFFTNFNHYSKKSRVGLVLVLLNEFLKKFTFAIFGRKPKDV